MEQEGIRINKYLSEAGVCSRRQADVLVEQGLVRVNAELATNGTKVHAEDQVYVRDELVVKMNEEPVVLAYYKPKGVVCSSDGQGAKTVWDVLAYPKQLYYVGRLDKESHGLLLLTNDGDLANAISKSRNQHEKEYEVQVNRPITKNFLQRMSKGVAILDTVTKPCVITQTGEKSFRIILTQGLNRQIRRMCEACGYRVKDLKRIRVLNVELGNLKTGEYRELTPKEREELGERVWKR